MEWEDIYEQSRKIANEALESLLEEREPACGEGAEQRIAKRLRDGGYLAARAEQRKRFCGKEAFQTLLCREKKHRRRRIAAWVGTAACVTVACGMAGWWVQRQETALSPAPAPSATVCKIETRAILIKGDGKQVVLGKEPLQTTEGNATTVAIDSTGVAYISRENPHADTAVTNVLLVPRGGMYSLTLCDGTRVWVNADSRLEYPVAFSGRQRTVRLSGEAYFDVAPNGKSPFVVKTGRGDITVTGTEFNVKCYADEHHIATTLVEGRVSFAGKGQEQHPQPLRPGEQAVWEESSCQTTLQRVNVRHYIGWKNNKLSFQEESLEDIMRTLSRWFNTGVVFENEELKALVFSGNMEKFSDLTPLLRLFELSSDARFEVKEGTVYIRKKK